MGDLRSLPSLRQNLLRFFRGRGPLLFLGTEDLTSVSAVRGEHSAGLKLSEEQLKYKPVFRGSLHFALISKALHLN